MDNWLWTPFLDPGQTGLAMLLLVVVAAFSVLCLWPVRVAGEITAEERDRARRGDALGTLLAWGVRLTPGLVVVGLFLLFFPLVQPRTVLLSSRAREIEHDQPDAWQRSWQALIAKLPREEKIALDLGPLVDAACERLLTSHDTNHRWDENDPAIRGNIIATLRDVLTTCEPTETPPGAASHRLETRLPRWVVETIELAILKGQSERCNAARFVVQVSDRRATLGQAWDALEPYLIAGSPRLRPAELCVERRPPPAQIRLEQVLHLTRVNPSGWRATCLFLVPPKPADEPASLSVQLRLHRNATPLGTSRSVPLELAAEPRLVPRDVTFPDAEGAEPDAVVQESEPKVRRPVSTHPRPGDITVGGRNDLPDWRQRWASLQGETYSLRHWQVSLERRGLPKPAWSEQNAQVILDTQTVPGSIWVYPARFPVDQLPRLQPADESGPLHAPRGGLDKAAPWLLAGENIPLPSAERYFTSPDPGTTILARRSLVKALIDGPIQSREVPIRPLIVHYERGYLDQQNERLGRLTHLGIAPTELTYPGQEPERTLVLWSVLIEAIQRASLNVRHTNQEVSEPRPLFVLEAGDLRQLRGASLLVYLVPLALGLSFYAALVVRGITGAPRQDGSTNSTGFHR